MDDFITPTHHSRKCLKEATVQGCVYISRKINVLWPDNKTSAPAKTIASTEKKALPGAGNRGIIGGIILYDLPDLTTQIRQQKGHRIKRKLACF